MILSHRHKFVFIRGRKVAGTSLEIALSQLCGPDDVISAMMPVEEIRRNDTPGHARNYSTDPAMEEAYREALRTRPITELAVPDGPEIMYRNHMRLAQVLRQAPEAKDYRLIFVERSPYEKVLSNANWKRSVKAYGRGEGVNQTMDGLVERVEAQIENGDVLAVRNIGMYRNADGEITSKGWRFETLQAELTAFCEEIGVPPVQLPHVKQGLGMAASEVRALLTPQQIAYIDKAFAKEFEAFGYPRAA